MSKPSVLLEIDEWDDTTDAIVWLIEKKFSDVRLGELKLTDNPYGWRGITTLEKQRARLEGWRDHNKVYLAFYAEWVDLPEKEEEGWGTIYTEGYRVTVDDITAARQRIAEYTVKGRDRKEFEIIEEKKSNEAD